jgi:hypothetical protein
VRVLLDTRRISQRSLNSYLKKIGMVCGYRENCCLTVDVKLAIKFTFKCDVFFASMTENKRGREYKLCKSAIEGLEILALRRKTFSVNEPHACSAIRSLQPSPLFSAHYFCDSNKYLLSPLHGCVAKLKRPPRRKERIRRGQISGTNLN